MPNTESIESITNYIENNYLTIEQLANQSNLSLEQLDTLINNACIPKHSHMINRQIVFHTDIFGDSVFTEQNKLYYHPSLVKWAMKASQYLDAANVIDVASKIKTEFLMNYFKH
jgi:hypothetical protein